MITSDEFLELERLPSRIVFISGGFIFFEFAHFAARLGPATPRCTILEAAPRPLNAFNEEMVDLLTAASEAEGVEIHCGVEIVAIEKSGGAFAVTTTDHGRFEADLVVNGAGRAGDRRHGTGPGRHPEEKSIEPARQLRDAPHIRHDGNGLWSYYG